VTYIMEPVDCCPVCGGEGTLDVVTQDREANVELRVYSCNDCATSYHNPRMSQSSMTEYYKSGAYRAQPERLINEATATRRIELALNLIDATAKEKPRRCLDVGCSRGYLSRALRDKYGADVVGYDIYHDPKAVIEVVSNKDYIEGKFDLITCIHVLEHLYDPLGELAWMASLLDKDGMLMLELPSARVVYIPHPIIFSRSSIPILMKHINADYTFIDMQVVDIGIVLAWKKAAQ
jgi:2-polyprenyl-3-methyl-5-hydroxy-6-metoxy-1,4-benzoquinol methylase